MPETTASIFIDLILPGSSASTRCSSSPCVEPNASWSMKLRPVPAGRQLLLEDWPDLVAAEKSSLGRPRSCPPVGVEPLGQQRPRPPWRCAIHHRMVTAVRFAVACPPNPIHPVWRRATTRKQSLQTGLACLSPNIVGCLNQEDLDAAGTLSFPTVTSQPTGEDPGVGRRPPRTWASHCIG